MRIIPAIIFIGLFLILGIPVLLIEKLISMVNPKVADFRQLRMVQWAFKVILFICGTKVTVIGEENVPTDEPVLYIGNHRSYFDIVISYSRCPMLTGYIAKDSMKRYLLISLWMRRLHCLFLNREDMKQSLKTILIGIEQIKKGISICIYPEGTRGDGETELDMLPFKEGSFKIAEKTGCKIIPMAITGSRDIFEEHIPWIKRKHVILEYGKPISINELTPQERKKLGDYCQQEILAMLRSHRDITE